MDKSSAAVALDYESLKEAFIRFNEASARLERKYQMLLEETATLREIIKQKDIEMKRQERLALLGETAAAIAHEVRNPLGAIKLFASLLRKDIQDNAKAVELVDQIGTSINALDQVVRNILLFSKDQKMNFAPVHLHSIIQEQVATLKRSIAQNAHFKCDLNGSGFIWGNEASLRHVLHNLILNSLQATTYGGTIRIGTTESKGCTILTLSDNGPGIQEGVFEKIFDPFVTTKNEGTGLGLAVVRKILIEHNASVSAVNDNGACFTIEFPKNIQTNLSKEDSHE